MNLNEYQKQSLLFQLPTAKNLSYLINGMAAEAGEVCGHYAKQVRDESDKTELIIKEIGDVLWFCAAIADFYGVPLADVAADNITKLQSRMERGVIKGSGDLR